MRGVADFASGGLGPLPLGSPSGGSVSALPCEAYQSPLLDLTQPALGIEIVPAKPGYFPLYLDGSWVIEEASGTQTTPAVVRAGSDTGRVNFMGQSSSPDNFDVNDAVGNTPCIGFPPANATVLAKRFINATVFMDVVSGASGTGDFSLKARLVIAVAWLAIG